MRSLLAVFVLLAAVVGGLLLWRGLGRASEPDLASVAESRLSAAAASAADAPATRATSEPVASRVAIDASAANPARVLGRCVDAATKAPLAGCTLTLSAFSRDRNAQPTPPRLTQATEADGNFALELTPLPGWSYSLEVAREDRASLRRSLREIAPGAKIECGDVALRLGVTVDGSVVDSKGVPRANVSVQLNRDEGGESGEFMSGGNARALSAPNGAFSLKEKVFAGTWRVTLTPVDIVLQSPVTLEIRPDVRSVRLELVTLADDEIVSISGVVVDELGAPVSGVMLDRYPRPTNGISRTVTTKKDGVFRFAREVGEPAEPVRLEVMQPSGFEPLRDDRQHEWGTKDLRLTLKRMGGVEIQVLDADSAAPIESYAVRYLDDGRRGGMQGRRRPGDNIKASGKHEGGIARIAGLPRGRITLVVEQAGESYVPTVHRFEVIDHTPRQTIKLSPLVQQLVRIVTADRSPVAGSQVRLLAQVEDEPITLTTRTKPLDAIYSDGGFYPQALELSEKTSDAAGEARVSGPPGVPLVLRVDGKAHRTVLKDPVVLDDKTPLEIVVSRGAVLRGKLGPLRALEGLGLPSALRAEIEQRQAGYPGDRARNAPGLRLQRPGQPRETLPADHTSKFPLGADGTFEIVSIAPGTWTVCLAYQQWLDKGIGSGMSVPLLLVSDLKDGETREVVLDASALIPGTLTGTVLVDGQPAANVRCSFTGRPLDPVGREATLQASVATDAEGRFEAKLARAAWRLHVPWKASDARAGMLTAAETITMLSDQTQEVVFHARHAKLTVRLVDGDGKPAANRTISLIDPDRGALMGKKTDSNGVVIIDPMPPGRLEAKAMPLELEDPKAQQEYFKSHGIEAFFAALIPLGPVEMPAEKSEAEITLRLL